MSSKDFHITPTERAYWNAMTPKVDFLNLVGKYNPHTHDMNMSYTSGTQTLVIGGNVSAATNHPYQG